MTLIAFLADRIFLTARVNRTKPPTWGPRVFSLGGQEHAGRSPAGNHVGEAGSSSASPATPSRIRLATPDPRRRIE